jgi:hypothetical protein
VSDKIFPALSPAAGVNPPSPDEGEYGAVALPSSWPVLSLLFFAAALASRIFVNLIPRELRPLPGPILTAVVVPALALVGLFFGFVGRRNPRTAGTSRLGIFLNAVTLVLSFLALFAYWLILRRA